MDLLFIFITIYIRQGALIMSTRGVINPETLGPTI